MNEFAPEYYPVKTISELPKPAILGEENRRHPINIERDIMWHYMIWDASAFHTCLFSHE